MLRVTKVNLHTIEDKVIPRNKINDDYCDCLDGTDETCKNKFTQ